MCKNPEKWGSCFQQALSVRPTVPHVLHVPEHVRAACPHSLVSTEMKFSAADSPQDVKIPAFALFE